MQRRNIMIIVSPVGGLANRMRGLNAAIGLAQSTDIRLVVFWQRNTGFNCSFDALFTRPAAIRSIIQVHSRFIWGTALVHVFEFLCSRLFVSLLQKDVVNLPGREEQLRSLAVSRNLFIKTHSDFFPNPSPFAEFRPVDVLQRAIDGYARQFDKHTVGVHIRRADNKLSIEHSPLEQFVTRMQSCIENDPQTRFYVSTDSPAEEKTLQEIFPGRVFIHPKRSLHRNDPVAIQDALVDLYCLSNCNSLIGSYWSSFSEVAAAIGDIPLDIAKK